MNTRHLSDAELISRLSLRDDLTALERDLLERLMRAAEDAARQNQYVEQVELQLEAKVGNP